MVLICAAALAAPLAAQDEDRAGLWWKFAEGQVLRYELSHITETQAGGKDLKQEQTLGLKYDVLSVDSGGAGVLNVTFERIRFRSSGVLECDYDSARDKEVPADLHGKILAGLVGRSFHMRLGVQGEVLEVAGMKKLLEEIVEKISGAGADGPRAEAIAKNFSDSQMKQTVQLCYGVLPEMPVGVRETWESTAPLELPGMGAVRIRSVSRLSEFRDRKRIAVIDQTGSILPPREGEKLYGDAPAVKEVRSEARSIWSVDGGYTKSRQATLSIIVSVARKDLELKAKVNTRLIEEKKGGGK
jgi:hypothetical protein